MTRCTSECGWCGRCEDYDAPYCSICGNRMDRCQCDDKPDTAACEWCGQVSCDAECPMGQAAREDAHHERKAS